MPFNRSTYFDLVRHNPFSGTMNQGQVDGQNAILNAWEWIPKKFPDLHLDRRWLAYMLATTYHETSQEMQPIEEYGKGSGQPYGEVDPETKQCYFGRGFVQLTWRDNYRRADEEIGLEGTHSCEWHADNALDLMIAARVMFVGMYQGWFRSDGDGPQALPRYFSETADDPYGAREIINGDKSKVPSWSNGVSIGKLIEGYHDSFLEALEAAWEAEPQPNGEEFQA
jgi:hypothetical protein